MKTNGKIGSIILVVLVIYAVSGFYLYNNYVKNHESKESSSVVAIVTPDELLQQIQEQQLELEAEILANAEPERVEVYDGLTIEELSDKLNRSLNSTIAGKGELFANYSMELGIDPYMAVAIVLHETGCTWDCSYLVKACNNVGGQKGTPSCGGGAYRSYPTLDDGIRGFMDNLYNNYYAYGLTTPELINPKYASSKTWATNVNAYIERIKAN